MSIKELLTSEESHVLEAKEIGKRIFEYPSDKHSEMLEVIKATVIRMHELEIASLNRV